MAGAIRALNPIRGLAYSAAPYLATALVLGCLQHGASQEAAFRVGEEGSRLSGTLVDEEGLPLAGWSVVAEAGFLDIRHLFATQRWANETTSDEHGRFVFKDLLGRSLMIIAMSPDKTDVVFRENFELDNSELTLQLRPDERATAFVEGLLQREDGLSVRAHVNSASETSFEWHDAESRDARFRLGPLRPGKHVVTISVEDLPKTIIVISVMEHMNLDVGTVVLRAAGWIAVKSARTDLQYGGPVFVNVLHDGRHPSGRIELTGGQGVSEGLSPGHYVLRTREMRWAAEDQVVDVLQGMTTTVKLPIEQATERVLAVRVPMGDPSTHVHVQVLTSNGSTIMDDELAYLKHGCFWRGVTGLVRGTYQIRACAPTGRFLVTGLTVSNLEPDYNALELILSEKGTGNECVGLNK